MRVWLVNPPAQEQPVARDMAGGLGFDSGDTIVLPPLDLAYLAATLRASGHAVQIVDGDALGLSRDELYRLAAESDPEVVIANVSLPTLASDCLMAKELGSQDGRRVILKTGITYPPLLEEMLRRSGATLCIFGECDLTIEQILRGEDEAGTARLEGGALRVVPGGAVEDLDQLPLPARDLLPNERYYYSLLGPKTTTMQTSRGCPYSCAYYCPYPLVQGQRWRARSPEHVYWEMEDIVGRHGLRRILLRDAVFTLDMGRTAQICELVLRNELELAWWCETRVDRLDLGLVRLMRRAGCQGINIGVETGDPEVLRTQGKPGLTLEKLRKVKEAADEVGLALHFLLMVGLPKETRRSIYQTYQLVQALKPASIGVAIVTPYPGTPLYAEAKAKGWVESEDWARYGGHAPVMHTDYLSPQDLAWGQRMLLWGHSLSRRPSPLARPLLLGLGLACRLWAALGKAG